MTILIELIAGPAAGKTTTALGLTNLLKFYFSEYLRSDLTVEYVSEYAKEVALEYQDACIPYHNKIRNQALLFGIQLERLLQLKDKANFIVNDSSLMLCAHYAPKDYYDEKSLVNLISSNYSQFDKVFHIYIQRDEKIKHLKLGRLENLQKSIEIDNNLTNMMKKYEIYPYIVKGNISAPFKIINHLRGKILPRDEDLEFIDWYRNRILTAMEDCV